MEWSYCDVYSKTVFVNSREKITFNFLIIQFIKTQKIIKVKYLIVLGEDVVCCLDMSDVIEAVLLSYNQHSYLHSLLFKFIFS